MDMTKQERIEEYQMEYDYIRDLLIQNPDDDDLIDAMYNTIDLLKENGGKVSWKRESTNWMTRKDGCLSNAQQDRVMYILMGNPLSMNCII